MNGQHDHAMRAASPPADAGPADDDAVARFLDAMEQRLDRTAALVGEVEQVQIMRRELPRARAGNPAAVQLLTEVAERFLSTEVAQLGAAAVAALG